MQAMPAGKRDKRITFEEQIDSQGATYGEAKLTSQVFYKCWASITPVSGSEKLGADRMQAEISHKIGLLFKAGINSKMRVNYRGRYFDIVSVINKEERNIELELLCAEQL